jgi:hypothetical protein
MIRRVTVGQPAEGDFPMAIPITPRDQVPRRSSSLGNALARLIGPIAFTLLLLGNSAVSGPAAAAPMCGERDEILARLQQRHDESPTALGLSSDGGVLEVLVSPEGGWTILITYPKRPTCVVAVGEAWQTLQLAGQPA